MTIHYRAMGGFWDDVADVASSAWDATGGKVFGLATDVFEGLPIYEPLKDLVEGPMRDFARQWYGRVVFRALATALTASTAWTLGPQLATIFWTVPGLARGEDFVTAWTSEFADRVQQTAAIVGGDAAGQVAAQVKVAIDDFATRYGVDDWIAEQAKDIASRLNIQEYAAEAARALWNGVMPPRKVDYDPVTGARKASAGALATFDPSKLPTSVAGTAARALAATQARGSVRDAQTAVAGTAARALAASSPIAVAGGGAPKAEAPRSSAGLAVAITGLVLAAGGLAYAATRR